ncbi:type II secretion system ATPase GspE [Legionella sp. W05-934-2]|uniref:type II secretion system ATPase GspE n=1 Tax=Legionella sp. W05-934-2 TaxID=1198649 RepID=UPI0034617D72
MMNDSNAITLPYPFAKKHQVVSIFNKETQNYDLYFYKTPDARALSEIYRLLGQTINPVEVSEEIFNRYMTAFYENRSDIANLNINFEDESLEQFSQNQPLSEDLLDTQDDAPIIRLINALFTQAIKKKASDIHIETYEDQVIVRFRIDGVLQQVLDIKRSVAPLVISRVKVMAKLDIAEKRIPQDGRISLKIGSHTIDVRVSTLPSNHGERIVLRILDKQAAKLDLVHLGMPDDILEGVRKLIAQPHGIILVTGPTGSGKTTSLYAMLTELNEISRNILTIEDPIEYDLPGIGQTQVNTKAGMSFAKGLRAILRQDPDVVMIGEIRDLETAEIAVQASLTGHLVLSTLHTNTAIGAVSRLHDMGVESFLLSSSLIGLIAQRLVRRLCDQCKKPHRVTSEEKRIMGFAHNKKIADIYEAVGCENCNHLGYQGRVGIYELIPVNEEIRTLIHRNESQHAYESVLRPAIASIRKNGFDRVLAGITTLEEILRVTADNN